MVMHFCSDDDVDVLEGLNVVHVIVHLSIRPPYKNVVEKCVAWRGELRHPAFNKNAPECPPQLALYKRQNRVNKGLLYMDTINCTMKLVLIQMCPFC
jgi:hypothetical protein